MCTIALAEQRFQEGSMLPKPSDGLAAIIPTRSLNRVRLYMPLSVVLAANISQNLGLRHGNYIATILKISQFVLYTMDFNFLDLGDLRRSILYKSRFVTEKQFRSNTMSSHCNVFSCFTRCCRKLQCLQTCYCTTRLARKRMMREYAISVHVMLYAL